MDITNPKRAKPPGRPKGIPDRRNIYKHLEPHIPELCDKLIALAKGGDTAAAKILFDRSIPVVKREHLPMALPIVGETPVEQAAAVLAAAQDGETAPADLAQAMQLINAAAQIAANTELLRRVEELEMRMADK